MDLCIVIWLYWWWAYIMLYGYIVKGPITLLYGYIVTIGQYILLYSHIVNGPNILLYRLYCWLAYIFYMVILLMGLYIVIWLYWWCNNIYCYMVHIVNGPMYCYYMVNHILSYGNIIVGLYIYYIGPPTI